MPALLELLAVLAVLALMGVALWRVWHPGEARALVRGPGTWAPHVAAVDNDTVVTVRRGGDVLEIARIAGDDPQWHAKLLDARAEAALRASALNTPD